MNHSQLAQRFDEAVQQADALIANASISSGRRTDVQATRNILLGRLLELETLVTATSSPEFHPREGRTGGSA